MRVNSSRIENVAIIKTAMLVRMHHHLLHIFFLSHSGTFMMCLLPCTHLFTRLGDLSVWVPDLVALVQDHVVPVIRENLVLVNNQGGEGSDEHTSIFYNTPDQVLLKKNTMLIQRVCSYFKNINVNLKRILYNSYKGIQRYIKKKILSCFTSSPVKDPEECRMATLNNGHHL